ncbi:MAG: carbon-nitrogen hydrolase family protein, partial [Burkholderiaceae bacterium]
MKVATIQMVSGVSVPANMERAGVLLDAAAKAGVELAMLPEYFCLLGQRDTDKLAVQEVFGQGSMQSFLAARA